MLFRRGYLWSRRPACPPPSRQATQGWEIVSSYFLFLPPSLIPLFPFFTPFITNVTVRTQTSLWCLLFTVFPAFFLSLPALHATHCLFWDLLVCCALPPLPSFIVFYSFCCSSALKPHLQFSLTFDQSFCSLPSHLPDVSFSFRCFIFSNPCSFFFPSSFSCSTFHPASAFVFCGF